MQLFFEVLGLIIIICLFKIGRKDKGWFRLLICITAILLMMALRANWGGDYDSYEDFFDTIKSLAFQNIPVEDMHGELGYRYLNYYMPSFRMVLVVTSLLYCAGLYLYLYKIIPHDWWILAFIILFIDKALLLGDISGIRNSIAVSAFLVGLYYIGQKKRWVYVVLLLAASTFHSSALLFIPFVLLPSGRGKFRMGITLMVFALLAIFAAFTPERWVDGANVVINNIDIFKDYSTYMEDTKEVVGARGLSYVMIFYMLIITLDALREDGYTDFEYFIMRFSLAWFVVTLSPAFGLTSRFYFYLDFVFLASSIIILSRNRNTIIKATYTLSLLIYYGLQLWQFLATDYAEEFIMQYHSILE